MNKFYSILDVQKHDGLYEIHPCNDDTISGYIKSENGILTDTKTNEVYTDKDIADVEYFEEEHVVYYKQIK